MCEGKPEAIPNMRAKKIQQKEQELSESDYDDNGLSRKLCL